MPVPEGPADRLAALGQQLVEVHQWLREELAALRRDLVLPRSRELPVHCLAFCGALARHHTAEDGGVFPTLAREYPELAPVLAELTRDHHQVSAILHRIEELVGGGRTDAVAAEFDGLAALLESHFGFEERKLVAVIDAMATGPAGGEPFGISLPDDW